MYHALTGLGVSIRLSVEGKESGHETKASGVCPQQLAQPNIQSPRQIFKNKSVNKRTRFRTTTMKHDL